MSLRLILLLGALAASARVSAQEVSSAPAEEPESPWSGSVKFGYLATSGNTENSNLNTSFGVAYSVGKWQHGFNVFAINATESNATTAESYEFGWTSERNLSEFNFLFGHLNWRNDRFSGVPEQFSQTVGYGRRLITSTAHMLNGEIGAGARQSERSDGVSENDLIIRAGLDYVWVLSETSSFTQDLVIEHGENNTYFESVTALRARLIGGLALVASYTIKNNSDVPVENKNTDYFTAISLEYEF